MKTMVGYYPQYYLVDACQTTYDKDLVWVCIYQRRHVLTTFGS